RRRDFLEGKYTPGERKDEQNPADSNRLHGGRLVRNGGPDHRPERRYTEGVQDRGHDERSRIAHHTKAEISEQQDKLEQDFRQRHRHEREYLSEQKFRSGDARDIDLQDGLLLSFPRHGERSQQGREHRDAQNEYPRAEEFLG